MPSATHLAFVGTYTQRGSEGIHVCAYDADTGTLEHLSHIGGIKNPSFLAIHPTLPVLYSVGETGADATVAAFSFDRTSGDLTPLNVQPAHGTSPCHLSVDQTGQLLVVANYSGGTVSAYPLLDDGRLAEASCVFQHEGSSINPKRQEGPHAHSATIDPTNGFVFVADLGIDQLVAYSLDLEHRTLHAAPDKTVAVAPGEGPRHFDFHPSGRFGYLITELGNRIIAYSYDAGVLAELQVVPTLPGDFAGTSHCADIHVSPDGRFVYGSNRGHDSLAIHAIEPHTGGLTLVGHSPTGGQNPRNFAIDPAGSYLLAANQDTDTIVTFAVDGETGMLEETGKALDVSMPVCIKLVAAYR